jgi:hypothetical protein
MAQYRVESELSRVELSRVESSLQQSVQSLARPSPLLSSVRDVARASGYLVEIHTYLVVLVEAKRDSQLPGSSVGAQILATLCLYKHAPSKRDS